MLRLLSACTDGDICGVAVEPVYCLCKTRFTHGMRSGVRSWLEPLGDSVRLTLSKCSQLVAAACNCLQFGKGRCSWLVGGAVLGEFVRAAGLMHRFAGRVQYCVDEGAHRSTNHKVMSRSVLPKKPHKSVELQLQKSVQCRGPFSIPRTAFQGAGMSHKGVCFQRVSSKGRLSRVCPTRASQKSVLQEYHEGSLQGVSAEHLPSLTGVAEKPFQRSVFETFEFSQGCLGKVSGTVPCASVHRSLKRVLAGLPHQGVPQSAHKERPSGVANTLEEHLRQAPLSKRVSWKSLFKERFSKVPDKGVLQECLHIVPRKCAPQECLRRMPPWKASFVCPARLPYRSVLQECLSGQDYFTRTFHKIE